MESMMDVLRRHPDFDGRKGTDIPSIEEIWAANTANVDEAMIALGKEQLIRQESADRTRRETEAERLEREASQLRARLRRCGVPERFLDVPADMTHDLTGGKGVYIYGRQGSGKTTKASGILKGWLSGNVGAAQFVASADLLTEIGATYSSSDTEQSVIMKYGRCKLLVVDDLGKENPTVQTLTKLWQVLDMRYREMLPTAVTTQHNFGELVAELGRQGGIETAKAIVSRLYETCEPLWMGDVDHRRKRA